MVVQHNISAMNANRLYGVNNSALSSSLEKLSSGYAINRAGDNAAGLAVSEKMRAQISGLTQASKNAEDGISMVQTYEGALQESDSILQRMRTLAVQSANGTYQDDVDREAIQLEYDQLNDELDQIADTDFNGVVALNGGQMADGLSQVDGTFDYANKASQLAASNSEKLQNAINAANEKVQKATDDLNAATSALKALGGDDISLNGAGEKWNTVDDSAYTKDAADQLWEDLGYTKADGTADTSTVNTISVTFTYSEADGEWTASSGQTNEGKSLTADQLTNFEVGTVTTNGGFDVTAGGVDVKAIFDSTELNDQDTVTLTFTNSDPTTYAPTHIGYEDDSFKSSGTSTVADYAVALNTTNLTDAKMTEGIKSALDDLNGLKFEAANDGKGGTALASIELTANGANGATDIFTSTDGESLTTNLFAKYDNGTGKVTFYAAADKDTATDDTAIATLTVKAAEDGTVNGTVKLDAYNYTDADNGPDVSAGSDASKDAVALTKARNAVKTAQDNLAAAQAAVPKTIDDLKEGVSKSDSNDASTATLTYADSVTLQVGARTKDSVNFTFNYSSNGLGDLTADLNCSASGLGTDKLSLGTQEDANAAIDKIDNAINKVSMVRATFGAVQNRLEHKINNLDTNNENLTAAESRIRDTDMAEEMTNFTKNQILAQASQAMLAQANQLPQGVLQLLG